MTDIFLGTFNGYNMVLKDVPNEVVEEVKAQVAEFFQQRNDAFYRQEQGKLEKEIALIDKIHGSRR